MDKEYFSSQVSLINKIKLEFGKKEVLSLLMKSKERKKQGYF